MCGVFGGIKNIDHQVIKVLGILNESRGTDSSGLFDLKSYVKHDKEFRNLVLNDDLGLLVNFDSYVIGHTRLATTGKTTKRNAHPFIYGNIIGVHNGMISNFTELKTKYGQYDMECDSEILFYLLNEFGVEGLKEVNGYYTIIWADRSKPDKVYFIVHECTLSYYRDKKQGFMYFCTDGDDLETATDCTYHDYKDALPDTLYEIDINTLKMEVNKIKGLQKYTVLYSYNGTGYSTAYDENDYYRQDDKKWLEGQQKYKESTGMLPHSHTATTENAYVTPSGIVSEKDGERYQAVKNSSLKCHVCTEELSLDEALKGYCGVCRTLLSGTVYQCHHCECLLTLEQVHPDNRCPECNLRMVINNSHRIEQAEMEV